MHMIQTMILLLSYVYRVNSQTRGLCSVWSVNYNLAIECIPPIITLLLSMATYLNIIFNIEKIKNVLLSIKNDHNYYVNRPENTILQHYAVQGSKIGFYYVSYVYTTYVMYVLLPTVTLVIDETVSSNHSEDKSFPVVLDYGVDMQQYFYHLFIPVYVSIFMVANVVASCDTTYMLYVQHIYALFAIVSHKLKTIQILDTNSSITNLKNNRSSEKHNNIESLSIEEKKIFREFVLCIKEHQNAINYSNLVESLFTKSILAQLFCNVICLSIGGVETVLNLGNAGDVMRFGSLALAQAIHIFVLCLPGQRLLNHSEEVYAAACEVMWCILPKKCHNLYKFLLARTMVFNKITAFKLTVMSMETFLAIIRTAMSYFTVLLSTT